MSESYLSLLLAVLAVFWSFLAVQSCVVCIRFARFKINCILATSWHQGRLKFNHRSTNPCVANTTSLVREICFDFLKCMTLRVGNYNELNDESYERKIILLIAKRFMNNIFYPTAVRTAYSKKAPHTEQLCSKTKYVLVATKTTKYPVAAANPETMPRTL